MRLLQTVAIWSTLNLCPLLVAAQQLLPGEPLIDGLFDTRPIAIRVADLDRDGDPCMATHMGNTLDRAHR